MCKIIELEISPRLLQIDSITLSGTHNNTKSELISSLQLVLHEEFVILASDLADSADLEIIRSTVNPDWYKALASDAPTFPAPIIVILPVNCNSI